MAIYERFLNYTGMFIITVKLLNSHFQLQWNKHPATDVGVIGDESGMVLIKNTEKKNCFN